MFQKSFFVFCAYFIFLLMRQVQAESPIFPHADPSVKTGFIEGKLFTQNEKGKKTFLKDHRVVLVVFYQGERILMLDKVSDAQGFFKFGNIFEDPNYAYALVSMLDDSLYVIPDIRLREFNSEQGEREGEAPAALPMEGATLAPIIINFWIGAGSSYFMANISDVEGSLESPMQQGSMGLAESQKAEYSVSARWAKTYQQMALVLSAVVLVLVILFAFSKTKIKN